MLAATNVRTSNMHEIICPHCDKAFKVDESGYAEILKQVRDGDFEKQLHERLELAERDKQSAVELVKAQVSGDLQKTAAAKDAEIQALKSKLESSEVSQKLAVTQALSAVEKERDTLANALAQAEREKKAASELAEALLAGELHKVSAAREQEIQELKAKLQAVELENKLAVTEAVGIIEKERDELKNGIKQVQLEKQLSEQAVGPGTALRRRCPSRPMVAQLRAGQEPTAVSANSPVDEVKHADERTTGLYMDR